MAGHPATDGPGQVGPDLSGAAGQRLSSAKVAKAARRIRQVGQSLWLDSINRRMLRSGDLAGYVQDLGVTGLTSNPTILAQAMATSTGYDASLRALVQQGVTRPEDAVYALALEDLAEAAALLRPTWEATNGQDGYVSLEVPPGLAYDMPATVKFAHRLRALATFPNLLVKIPGTPQGLAATEEVVDAGIGVNVTLLFSSTHYLQAAEAYLRALERRQARGASLDVPSVASVFVSRWDVAADPRLPSHLQATLGLAMAQKACSSYRALFSSPRWQGLAAAGAHRQRLLWASTSAKGPSLPITYYADRLVAPGTIDTMPERVLLALGQQGGWEHVLEDDYGGAELVVAAVAKEGLDVEALGQELQQRGASAFTADWERLLEAIAVKMAAAQTAA